MAEDIYILKTNWNTRFFNQPERFMDLQQAMNDAHSLLVNDQGYEEHIFASGVESVKVFGDTIVTQGWLMKVLISSKHSSGQSIWNTVIHRFWHRHRVNGYRWRPMSRILEDEE